jgi:hypothetical protein
MKMYLDIETIPAEEKDKEALLDIYTRRLEKSKKDIGTFEEYLETTNFDGSFGRICCLSYAIDDGPTQSLSGDEKKILSILQDTRTSAEKSSAPSVWPVEQSYW